MTDRISEAEPLPLKPVLDRASAVALPLAGVRVQREPAALTQKTGRLVIVSNRVGPVRGAARAGGLAVALVEALREAGGLWFGWSGNIAAGGEDAGIVQKESFRGITTATLDLTEDEHHEYYNGFANQCLWPLFHYRIDLTAYDRQFYEGYLRVNTRFAQALQPLLREDDVLWVHDYHLIPFAEALRGKGASQRIGFFLHIPFPSREVALALPHHDQLARSLMAYDLVGFHTQRDVERFIDYMVNEIGGEVVDATGDASQDVPKNGAGNGAGGVRLRLFGRECRVRAFPIGIDARAYADLVHTEDSQRQFQRVKSALRGRTQIIGVDRLDYTKGRPERFAAFERLLADHADARGRVEFLQVAPLSREGVAEYAEIRSRLEGAASRINGQYAEVDWTPLHYINRTLSRRALSGLYRASKVGLVTPLRDGMNLVAKEYVAAQDPDDPGVLVLSRFAGSAWQMKAALIVNPYDTVEVAEAMQTARYMDLGERKRRHSELMQGLLDADITHWRRSFLQALAAS